MFALNGIGHILKQQKDSFHYVKACLFHCLCTWWRLIKGRKALCNSSRSSSSGIPEFPFIFNITYFVLCDVSCDGVIDLQSKDNPPRTALLFFNFIICKQKVRVDKQNLLGDRLEWLMSRYIWSKYRYFLMFLGKILLVFKRVRLTIRLGILKCLIGRYAVILWVWTK